MMSPTPEHVIASINDTSLRPEEYLRHLGSDGARLRAVATDLTAPVPSCPEWTVSDLVAHVAAVYSHKTAAMTSGKHPADGQWATAPPDGLDVLSWYDTELASIERELSARASGEPSWTWWPPDQSVGFWQRRMAQETLVHRWDAELAAGSTTALDPELATDGIDEILGWLGWEFDEPAPGAAGQTVLVRTPGLAWTVTLDPMSAVVAAASGAAEPGGAVIEGSPEQLLLHLWGRAPQDAVTQTGDQTALRLFAERLAQV
jgi:uncharacterized protein (TIGR03083 family)